MSVLVAGLGNVFLGDDGFGVEVVRRLRGERLPAGVRVVDYGIRGTHLAFDLLDPPALLIAVDAHATGFPPGTVTIAAARPEPATGSADAHGMDLSAVLAHVRALGGRVPQVRVVGCVPSSCDPGLGLSPPVAAAVAPAAAAVMRLVLSAGGVDDLVS